MNHKKKDFCGAKKREPPPGFVFSRLLLFGNPLDCVCENLWIKLRLLEEADGQDLKCTDDSGESHAFITLTPPDCGNVTPYIQPNTDGFLILNMRWERWKRNLCANRCKVPVRGLVSPLAPLSCSGSQSGGQPK